MKTKLLSVVLCLPMLLMICLTSGPPQQAPAKITISGQCKKVERFDKDLRLHGLQEFWVGGVINHERMVDHGQVLWRKEYNGDGSLKEHWTEGEDYNLTPVYYQTDR
jgi:hypothetical protein